MLKNLLICLILLPCGVLAQNKFADKTLQAIYTAQDQRDSKTLLGYFTNESPAYREQAALAFASVQDTNAVNELVKLLIDSDAKVRQSAVYALGQTCAEKSEAKMIEIFALEKEETVKATFLEAIGKCATVKGLEFLVNLTFKEPALQLGQGRGIYRAGLKRVIADKGHLKMLALLKSSDIATRQIASAYWARALQDVKKQTAEMFAAFSDADAFVRMNIAAAIGKLKTPEALAILKTRFEKDTDYRVKVAILRALGNFKLADVQSTVFKAIESDNEHIAVTASETLVRVFESSKPMQAIAILGVLQLKPSAWQAKINLWQLANQTSATPKINLAIQDLYQKSENVYQKGALLKALAAKPDNYAWIAEKMYQTDSRVLQVYAMQALAQIRRDTSFKYLAMSKPQVLMTFGDYWKWAINTKDVGLVYEASQILSDEKLGYKGFYKDTAFLYQARDLIQLPRDIEAFIELQRVIALFEGKPAPTDYPKAQLVKIDWEEVNKINPNQTVLMQTNKGKIRLQLFVEDAPGSVETIVKLINKGFYDGKTFHRIVPDFVAQGGCPRGDGYGGLEYTIRSEFAPLYYGEGYIGLASAGKDTESCQFFFTHNPTPHLDGRYTIFAKVIEGMDIVHLLGMGDKMEKVSVE
jgi:cyclophilin family peptidyl-prolyl cis-trans isomerase